MGRIGVLAAIVAAIVIAGDGPVGQAATGNSKQDSLRNTPAVEHQKYIVVFKSSVADPARMANGLARQHGASPRFVYQHAIKGFAVTLPPQAAHALSQNPNV
ncbi:MAG: protease inhibitor I9 family protein, partial [Candidatus Krumholzibacteria bacterium]|nr:protease inhibitor I9 family protein [Candidatus Krumholzibacteria bacterium]